MNMKLIGRKKLATLKGINNEVDKWVAIWVRELTQKIWFSHVELQSDYPRMIKIEGSSTFIFPVSPSDHSVKVCFYFEKKIALISEVVMGKEL
jgi:mRNA-degrading endonuclease HigB of HigAB toxin-antitoxin module